MPCHHAERLGLALDVLPISMSLDGELLHRHLWGYKRDRSATTRVMMTRRLAALLAVFLANHRDCVGDFDSVTGVPSPARCAPDEIITRVRALLDAHVLALEATDAGTKADLRPDRFRVGRSVEGERVLLLDDTFTSGATLFSAAAALRQAGAVVVGPVVIGRHVQPSWPTSEALLGWLRGRRWDETRCCRCDGERASPDRLPY